jgi:quinol monooxygenase YgiN
MTSLFGVHGSFTAHAGRGDELTAILLEAADALGGEDDCLLYVVSRSPDDAETVWVTEAWTDRAAHAASLQQPATRALIARARPLIAGIMGALELRPVGGKGLDAGGAAR